MNNTMGIREAWESMGHRLAIVIPLRIVQWLDKEKTEAKRKHPLTVLIILLIMVLSAASVTNLYTRANAHHPGPSAMATGAGLALLVPIAIFFAVYVPLGRAGRIGVWCIAIVFAAMSAAIQYKIYAPADGGIDIEAIAFGTGIPVAECLLAVLEGILISHLAKQAEETERMVAAKEHADIEANKAADQMALVRIEEQRKAEEQRKIDVERQQAEFDFDMQAKRLRLELELELERKKIEAKLNKPKAEKPSDAPVIHESKKSDSDESRIKEYYRINALASQRRAAAELGVSQPKISRILNDLESKKVIHRNGNGVEIL